MLTDTKLEVEWRVAVAGRIKLVTIGEESANVVN
jgi:hypothetical protein